MFIMEGCPHCKRALAMTAELFAEHPEYKKVPFMIIDENKNPEIAEKYNYYYVPTFYTGDEKMMEGVPAKKEIEKAFARAFEKS